MTNFNEGGATQPGYPRVKYRKVIIPNTRVRTLRTAFNLVPAPGDGRIHLVHMVYIHKPGGTAFALTGGGELLVRYGGGSGDDIMQFDASDFASGSTIRRAANGHSPNTGNADKTVSANDALELQLSGANQYTGGAHDTPFNVHIYYQTIVEDE